LRTLLCGGLLTVLALCAVAADATATGKWSGSFNMSGPDGNKESTAVLMLKQDGGAITGSVGPNEGEQFPIKAGKIEGGKISLDVDHEGQMVKFELVLAGDRITGDANISGDGKMTAKINVTRSK